MPYVIGATDSELMVLAHALDPKRPTSQQQALEFLADGLIASLLALGRGLKGDDGQPLTTAEAMRPRAQAIAQHFLATTLPRWQKLGVI